MTDCHCGKDGHALNSVNCPEHGTFRLDRFHLADLLLCYGEFGTTTGASKEGALRCADAILSVMQATRRLMPNPAQRKSL